MILARGATTAGDSGFSQGTLTYTAGTLDVTALQIGVQRANNTATETGVLNVNGTAILVSTNIVLAQTNAGANASLVIGSLNVTNGTVRGNIFAGGGNSIVNLNGGTLVVSNNVGTTAVPLAAFNVANASVHLKVDGGVPAANVNVAAVSASGTTTITVDSVANVTAPTVVHLLSYTGADPFANFALAPLPAGYSGALVDNANSIDLSVNVSIIPLSPTIDTIQINGGEVILNGTNNSGAVGTYKVLTSTNLTVPLASWTVLTNGSFDTHGNFSSTNAIGSDNSRFYILQVP
jgi:hypothetical protein